ncbi:hypothetical protein SELMODRAFT_145906 [Selaginella moellendorffii]|uniref:Metallo-beta-lactamase domain-containing protein n=1 Tax=Selaginella moellendorffii TaxID=88036 RepID=D8RCF1_SELML|nr:hypothetical protein SELMODRAFT_145906 [Selaginella moellendorffii]
MEANGGAVARDGSELIVLGSGSSTGVPSPVCLLRPSDPPCAVCHKAIALPPQINKNYRCNPSLLIKFLHGDGELRFIQIDAGKHFKEQVLRWYLPNKVPRLDAILLTHEHADAMLGLDEIRGVQPYNSLNRIKPLSCFLSQETMNSVAEKFPYLVQKGVKEGQEIRRVTQLNYKIVQTSCDAPFDVEGLEFTPLPVMHGEDYPCLGFLFGRKSRVAYISDVSRILPETEQLISQESGGQVDLLFLDTLYKKDKHNTHFCFPQSLEAVKRIRPKRALFVGMTHEFDHELDNEFLANWSKIEGIDVRLAYDGLRIPIDL